MSKPNHAEIMENISKNIKMIDDKLEKFREEIKIAKETSTVKHPKPASIQSHKLADVILN